MWSREGGRGQEDVGVANYSSGCDTWKGKNVAITMEPLKADILKSGHLVRIRTLFCPNAIEVCITSPPEIRTPL